MANITPQKQQYIELGIGVAAIVGLGFLVFGVLCPKNPALTALPETFTLVSPDGTFIELTLEAE